MFRHFITSINYAKLIKMQANQETFAPKARSASASLKYENRGYMRSEMTKISRKNKAKIKVYGKSGKIM